MPPPTFAEEHADAWDRWVLEHGLPPLPGAQIAVGHSVPVAFWVGPRAAAVLHVRRVHLDDEPEPWAESDVHLFGLVDGRWEGCGSGGAGGWSGDALARREVAHDAADLGGTVFGRAGEAACTAVWGEVGSGAAHAELEQSGVVTRHRVVAPIGFCVVAAAAEEPFTVRVLHHDGRVLAEVDERDAEW